MLSTLIQGIFLNIIQGFFCLSLPLHPRAGKGKISVLNLVFWLRTNFLILQFLIIGKLDENSGFPNSKIYRASKWKNSY